MQEYSYEILRILIEASPEGLKVGKIVRHVYNATNSLFHAVAYADVEYEVKKFLRQQSAMPDGMVCRTAWGVYAINSTNSDAKHLMLDFKNYRCAEPDVASPTDNIHKDNAADTIENSLPLFPDD